MVMTDKIPELKYMRPKPASYLNLPQEIISKRIFTAWRKELGQRADGSPKWKKPNVVGTGWQNNPITIQELNANQKYAKAGLAMLMSHDHPYFMIDVDGVDLTLEPLKSFIKDHPSLYIEESPSGQEGNRYHILLKLSSAQDKHKFKGRDKINIEGHEVELFMSTGYCTLTCAALPESRAMACEVTSDELLRYFPSWQKTGNVTHIDQARTLDSYAQTTATENDINAWVEIVPLSKTDHMVQKYCSEKGVVYYDYWLTGLQALHVVNASFAQALRWCQKDSEYYNEEEVFSTWNSFQRDANQDRVEMGTFKMMKTYFGIVWPDLTGTKNKDGKLYKPDKASYDNFTHLMNHLGLKLKIDNITKTEYIDGPDAILYHKHNIGGYFKGFYRDYMQKMSSQVGIDRMSTALVRLFSKYDFKPPPVQVTTWLKNELAMIFEHEHVSRFGLAVDHMTPDGWDGVDRLKIIADKVLIRDSLEIHPTRPYQEMMVKKWFVSLYRHLWPELIKKHMKTPPEGMLILSDRGGSGGIGKSTFFRKIIPHEFDETHRLPYIMDKKKGIAKDDQIMFSTALLGDLDEIDNMLSYDTSNQIKSQITLINDSYVPKYKNDVHRVTRKVVFSGSTNMDALKLPDHGARRFFWINVEAIGQRELNKLDLWQVCAQVKHMLIEAKNDEEAPWSVTQEDRDYIQSYLGKHRQSSGLKQVLYDLYEFSESSYEMALSNYAKTKGRMNTIIPTAPKIRMVLKEAGYNPHDLDLHGTLETIMQESIENGYIGKEQKVKGTIFEDGKTKSCHKDLYLMPMLSSDLQLKGETEE